VKPWVDEHIKSSPDGAKEIGVGFFCRPCRDLDGCDDQTHGFTVGYYLTRLRRWGNHLPMLVRFLFQMSKSALKASQFCKNTIYLVGRSY
jgi:hypothetical protein